MEDTPLHPTLDRGAGRAPSSFAPIVTRMSGALLGDRFLLERLLGAGGMGEVWEARHLLLDRVVAVKLLNPEARAFADRLVAEARALARIRHPAIVEVYDCGVLDDGAPYIVMERLHGETLAQRLSRGRLPIARAARLFIAVLDGLAAAHRAGVVHRDLKPENIFLAGAEAAPRLIDFGIARLGGEAPRRTMVGTMMGTPAYMSPEQFRGEPVDERADIWCATVSLYETVTGVPPFGDDAIAEVRRRVSDAPVPFPRDVPGLDGRFFGVLARGLRKVPAQRFPSAEAMRAELEAWLAARDGDAPRTSLLPDMPEAAAPRPTPPAPASRTTPLDEIIRRKLGRD